MKLPIILCSALLLCTSCDLLEPGETRNPNVAESDFVRTPGAMSTWVNGTNARFAAGLTALAENLEVLSDNLYNNSSLSNKTWDRLEILYTDGALSIISTRLGEMIQMANFGLNSIAKQDSETTQTQCFKLYYIKACAYLMAAENFVALPIEAHDEVADGPKLAEAALQTLERASSVAASSSDKALVALLQARAYRLQSRLEEAENAALGALALDSMLLFQAQFDDLNEIPNTIHQYIAQDLFTLHTSLADQKVKFPKAAYYEQPFAFAKSEEACLIVAECALLQGRTADAQAALRRLYQVVEQREAQVTLLSTPSSSLQSIPSTTHDLLTLIYRLRQETFCGEGRRSSDLGIRLPLSEVEISQQHQLPDSYKLPIIPEYITTPALPLDEQENVNARLASYLLQQ